MSDVIALTRAQRLLRLKPRPNITKLFSHIEDLWDLSNKVMNKPLLVTMDDVEALQRTLYSINSLIVEDKT